MRVLILGGYGVFGSRLGELLTRDGCEVVIAGRNGTAAREEAARIGGAALTPRPERRPRAPRRRRARYRGRCRRSVRRLWRGSLPASALLHVAGHRLSRSLRRRAFTAGIAELDAAARDAGRFALSGASSVPGLSSAVVTALASDLDRIDIIETAILPGNRAPRGRVRHRRAFSARPGRPMRIWNDGAWQEMRSLERAAPDRARASTDTNGLSHRGPGHCAVPGAFSRAQRRLPRRAWSSPC